MRPICLNCCFKLTTEHPTALSYHIWYRCAQTHTYTNYFYHYDCTALDIQYQSASCMRNIDLHCNECVFVTHTHKAIVEAIHLLVLNDFCERIKSFFIIPATYFFWCFTVSIFVTSVEPTCTVWMLLLQMR